MPFEHIAAHAAIVDQGGGVVEQRADPHRQPDENADAHAGPGKSLERLGTVSRDIGPEHLVFQAVTRKGELRGDEEVNPLLAGGVDHSTQARLIPGEVTDFDRYRRNTNPHQTHG